MRNLILLIPLIMCGCSMINGETPISSVTVTKLGVSGEFNPFNASAGGYRLEIGGDPQGVKFTYKDDMATIEVRRGIE